MPVLIAKTKLSEEPPIFLIVAEDARENAGDGPA
jgi:hypothetical protein